MKASQILGLAHRLRGLARQHANARGFLPPSISPDDMAQEGYLVALEKLPKFNQDGSALFATYVHQAVVGRWSDMMARSHYGPPSSTRSWRRKRGLAVDYGEVSVEVLGDNWQDFVADDPNADDDFCAVPACELVACLADIDRQIDADNSIGISFAKTRNKWHVAPIVCGKEQFVGQFNSRAEAVQAKRDFLRSFRFTVADCEVAP